MEKNFTHICSVMWSWSYEGFLEVRERTGICTITVENIWGQRRQRRGIRRRIERRDVGAWGNGRRSRHRLCRGNGYLFIFISFFITCQPGFALVLPSGTGSTISRPSLKLAVGFLLLLLVSVAHRLLVSLQQMVLFGQNPSQGTLLKASQFLSGEPFSPLLSLLSF